MFTRIHRVWPCIVSLAALLTAEQQTSVGGTQPKLLIVVAHPDDEYMFAATTYRLVRELHWVADQVVIQMANRVIDMRRWQRRSTGRNSTGRVKDMQIYQPFAKKRYCAQRGFWEFASTTFWIKRI